jgi:hypothetical protein
MTVRLVATQIATGRNSTRLYQMSQNDWADIKNTDEI